MFRRKVKQSEGQLALLNSVQSDDKRSAWETRIKISVGRSLQKKPSAPITARRSQEYAKQYESGMTLREIAAVHGFRSKNSIRVALRKIAFNRYRKSCPRRTEALERRIAQQIKLYETGLTVTQVARRLGLKKSTVYCSMRSSGYKFRTIKESRRLTLQKRDAKFCTAYAMGLTIEMIASKFGVSNGLIQKALKRNGVPVRTSGQYKQKRSKAKVQEYWRAYESGMSLTQIAKMYKIAPSGVAALLNRHGYKLRSLKEARRVRRSKLNEIMPAPVKPKWRIDEA